MSNTATWNIPDELGHNFTIFDSVHYGTRVEGGRTPIYQVVNDWYVEEFDITSILLTVDTQENTFNEIICKIANKVILTISIDTESLPGVPISFRITYPKTGDGSFYRLTLKAPRDRVSHSLAVLHSHTHPQNVLASENRYESELDSRVTVILSNFEFKIVESLDLNYKFVDPDEEELIICHTL